MNEKELLNKGLSESELENVDGGLVAELGLAAAMTFGQVAPAMNMQVQTPIVETQQSAIQDANVSLVGGLVENGGAQTQGVSVVVNGMTLTENVDYTVSNNVASAAGTYTLTVQGIGAYTGVVYKTFTVAQNPEIIAQQQAAEQARQEAEAQAAREAEAQQAAQEASEKTREKEAEEQAKKGQEAQEDVPETDPVTPEEDVPEVDPVTPVVEAEDISDCNIILTSELVANGSEQTQNVAVRWQGMTLTEGVDYEVSGNTATEAGTYTLTVTGIGACTGSATCEFTVAEAVHPLGEKNIATSSVELVGQLVYNGAEQVQDVVVRWQGMNLTEGVDYEVTGNTATEVGTYTLTVKGIGEFTGEQTLNFTINPASEEKTNIAEAQVTVPELVYNGASQTANIAVRFEGGSLQEGRDYKVSGNTATEAGTYKVTITGMGDFEGSTTVNFTIARCALGTKNVQLGQLVTSGKNQVQTVIVNANGKTLKEGKDYTVTNNVASKEGTYTLTVTGIGNYSGQINVQYKVGKQGVHTGEQTNVGLFAGVAAAAAAGLAVLAFFSKMRKKG